MAKVFLDAGDSFKISTNNVSVYGSTGNESVTVDTGVTGTLFDQNTENVVLPGASSTFKFAQSGNRVNVFDSTGATLLATIPVQGDASGTVIDFSDGSASAILSSGVMKLGGSTVSSTAGVVTPTLGPSSGNAVAVSAAGTGSAAGGNVTFNVAAGTYLYTITGFGTGDKIGFPAGNTPTVVNESFTDGSVIVQWAKSGNQVEIKLTGLTSTQDGSLNSVTDFNTLFGTGTIF